MIAPSPHKADQHDGNENWQFIYAVRSHSDSSLCSHQLILRSSLD